MLASTVGISFAVQILLIYFAPLQGIFQTTSLSFRDLILLLSVASVVFVAHEFRRRWERRQSTVEAMHWEESVV